MPVPASRPQHLRGAALAALLCTCVAATAAAVEPPPEPLTLARALTYADSHPRLTAAEPPPRPQPLYLACHNLAFADASGGDYERDLAWSPLLPPIDAQRLEIMQRFYDVLLADLSYMRDNEAMAVGFIQFDRAQARSELGQYSPLAVAELEAAYQLIRRRRAASDAARRLTRSLLAQAIGTPEDLPKTLVAPPPQPDTDQAPPELDAVVAKALEHNALLRRRLADADQAADALLAMAVRQRALELLMRLEVLAVAAEQTRVEADWRELKLDQSRTLYEMEVTADLGYSMSQQTKARRDELAIGLCQALTRAELDALQGLPVSATPGEPAPADQPPSPAQPQPEPTD